MVCRSQDALRKLSLQKKLALIKLQHRHAELQKIISSRRSRLQHIWGRKSEQDQLRAGRELHPEERTDGRSAVRRHALRGVDAASRREIVARENAQCRAGLRNPASFMREWPELVATMQQIHLVLLSSRADDVSLQNLADCLGEEPVRRPPLETSIRSAREKVAAALGARSSRRGNTLLVLCLWLFGYVASSIDNGVFRISEEAMFVVRFPTEHVPARTKRVVLQLIGICGFLNRLA